MIFVLGSVYPEALQAQIRPPSLPQASPDKTACRYETAGQGTVATVTDGRSFVLTDGREVRLAGLEVPIYRPDEVGPRAIAGHAAKAKLESILAGATVGLSWMRPNRDRYGRTIAYVDVLADGLLHPVAGAMVQSGFAQVGTQVDTLPCAAELLSQERAARASKLGLWADPYYVLFEAENGTALLEHQGQFAIVEGKVSSVRTSGGTIYINFGRRWSETLTVTIQKRHERMFVASGVTPALLGNRRIRVRGWIEERGGPRMEATRPEQIEIAERM